MVQTNNQLARSDKVAILALGKLQKIIIMKLMMDLQVIPEPVILKNCPKHY